MEIQQAGYRYTFSSAAGDFDVISFQASEQLSQVFQLRLSLSRMNEKPVNFSDVLDNPGTLTLWQDIYGAKIPVRYFNGIISFFHQTQTGKRRTQYTAVLTPSYSRTQLYSNLRIYQEKTVPDIIKIILGTDGIAPVRFDLIWKVNTCHGSFVFNTEKPTKTLSNVWRQKKACFITLNMTKPAIHWFLQMMLEQ